MTGPILGEDGVSRCPWGSGAGPMRDYHDTEWGVRIAGESAYLERLTLEAFQSGLSWSTILSKREAFREVFAGFDAERVAAYGEADAARLMGDARIVRNRRKIDAAITNARATIQLRADGGLEQFVLGFAPEQQPTPATQEQVATSTPESLALSKALKKRGFAHVGPTTMQALMEATGIVEDHLLGCHRRR